VVVLRTLSKAWGLAGMRVGFLVAAPEVVTAVRKVLTPFSTSVAAQAGALAALRQPAEMRRRCALVIGERARVTEAMRKLVPAPVVVPQSQANFIWLPLAEAAVPFATACAEGGVLVRPFAGEGVRVTIGTPEENDALLGLAAQFFAA
jgi:histidinol-phosphate aminotransferase